MSDFARAREIFETACRLPPEARAAFLDEACGDDAALRSDVESLLVHDLPPEESGAGDRVGPYRIIQEVGRGGIGVVYVAVREDAELTRRVALKVLQEGMRTDEILRRFALERQVLAALNHPNIARLYDAGRTDDGRPYFVMEYVEGLPIDAYCNTHRLRPADRLRLFQAVCSAVHHAHQNLIVHRDLKPANVLVTEDGVPKLLDFGIAKLVNPDLAFSVVPPTAPEMRIMTPEYASPEQVRGAPITTASDVYSLGVLLYELVCGRRPYRFRSRIRAEIERIVCEEEPELPSTAVSRVEEIEADGDAPDSPAAPTAPLVAARADRNRKLRRELRGDVDNIVLMAMRKEPQRRYRSAEQFAEDIGRHLDDMPVIARRDSVGYRLARFAKRNRWAVTGGIVVALSLVIGLLATGWGWRTAVKSKQRVDHLVTELQDTTRELLTSVHGGIKNLSGSMEARIQLLQLAETHLELLETEAADRDSAFTLRLAETFDDVGDLRGSDRAENIGETDKALVFYRRGRALREMVLEVEPDNRDANLGLAASHLRIGDLSMKTGRMEAALKEYRAALAIVEGLVPTNPALRRRLAIYLTNVGKVLVKLEEDGDARHYYQRSAEIREQLLTEEPENPRRMRDLARQYILIGGTHEREDRVTEAVRWYRDALVHAETSVAMAPDDSRAWSLLMQTNAQLAQTLVGNGSFEEATTRIERAVVAMRQRADDDPRNITAKRNLAITLGVAGDVHMHSGATERARDVTSERLAIARFLVREDPTPAHKAEEADALRMQLRIGARLRDLGLHSEAQTTLDAALTDLETLHEETPGQVAVRDGLIAALRERSRLAVVLGDGPTANAMIDRALEIAPEATEELLQDQAAARALNP